MRVKAVVDSVSKDPQGHLVNFIPEHFNGYEVATHRQYYSDEPSFKFEIMVQNPLFQARFQPGKVFYLDINEA